VHDAVAVRELLDLAVGIVANTGGVTAGFGWLPERRIVPGTSFDHMRRDVAKQDLTPDTT
jgi:hypothetical protein